MQLQQFDKKTVTSVEKEMRSGPAEETVVTDETLELKEQTELTDWVKVTATQGQFVFLCSFRSCSRLRWGRRRPRSRRPAS